MWVITFQVLQVAFIIMKLCGAIDWNWFLVLAIWEMMAALCAFHFLLLIVLKRIDPNGYAVWLLKYKMKRLCK